MTLLGERKPYSVELIFFYFFTCFVHRTYCYVVLWKYEDRVIPARFLSEMKDRSALYLQ